MKKHLKVLAALGVLACTHIANAQHIHGFTGDANGDGYLDFVSSDTGVGSLLLNLPGQTLTYEIGTNGSTGVDYSADGFDFNGPWTPTALHGSNSTVSNPQGALSGTNIKLTLYAVSYAGPATATLPTFAIYDSDSSGVSLSNPSVTMTAGSTGGSAGIVLTEQDYFELTPSDPYGHIHGRRFAATDAGTYTITWALENIGSGGTASSLANPDLGEQLFTQTWNAVPEPQTWALVTVAGCICLFFLRKRGAENS